MRVELRVPTSGESITEVEIADWFKSAGDRVRQDEPVVLLETDKAAMELPAPVAGVFVCHQPALEGLHGGHANDQQTPHACVRPQLP